MHKQTRRGSAQHVACWQPSSWSAASAAAACGGDNKSSLVDHHGRRRDHHGRSATPPAERPPRGGAATRCRRLAQAQALVAQYTHRPTKLDLTTPVGKPIPTGKTIYSVTCGAEACDAEADDDQAGHRPPGLEPQGAEHRRQPTAGPERLGADRPGEARRRDLHRRRRGRRSTSTSPRPRANGTKIAACCIVEPATNGIVWTTSTPDQAADLAKVMAAWPIVDAAKTGNMKPGAVYLNVPDFSILTSAGQSMKKTYNELCPGCEYNQLDIGLADLNGAPDQVVSFLRAHPDTKYIIQSTDSVFLGVPAALKAAGLNDVKIFGEGPTSAVQANIASGVQAGTMAFAFYEIMFGGGRCHRPGGGAECPRCPTSTRRTGSSRRTTSRAPTSTSRSCRTRWISSKRSGGSSPDQRRSASRSHRRRGRASPTTYSSAAPRPVNQGVTVDIERTLQDLVDRQQITDVLYRYASTVDYKDYPTMRALFTDDAVGKYGGGDAIHGADNIVAWIDSATQDRGMATPQAHRVPHRHRRRRGQNPHVPHVASDHRGRPGHRHRHRGPLQGLAPA